MLELNIAGIVIDSVVDGPGLRVCIFSQGCPHLCEGCHNPETHSFDTNVLISVSQLFDIIKTNPLCRGVTFSGGEPFSQADAFFLLAKELKTQGYEIACYSGFTFEELCKFNDDKKKLLSIIDVLIDGRYVESKRNSSLKFRGSENQRIIDVQKSLILNRPVLVESKRWSE